VLPGDPLRARGSERRVVDPFGDRLVEVHDEAAVERQPGDEREVALRRAEAHLDHARVAPAADRPVAVHDDTTRARAVEQRTDDLVDRLVGEDRTEIARHVARPRALVRRRPSARGAYRVEVR